MFSLINLCILVVVSSVQVCVSIPGLGKVAGSHFNDLGLVSMVLHWGE